MIILDFQKYSSLNNAAIPKNNQFESLCLVCQLQTN